MNSWVEQFKDARRVSTPIIVIRTPDQQAAERTLHTAFAEAAQVPPILHWDCARGLIGMNSTGVAYIYQRFGVNQSDAKTAADQPLFIGNPAEMLLSATLFPPTTLLLLHNMQNFLTAQDLVTRQALCNLRDVFKLNKRTVVLLCPSVALPIELEQDVLVLDDPLPDDAAIDALVRQAYSDGGHEAEDDDVEKAVDGLTGLTRFAAEQAAYMSLRKEGLDIETLRLRHDAAINQRNGLRVVRPTRKFDCLGGWENEKSFLQRISHGREAPRLILFIDEVEKAVAGNSGDLTGISQDYLGQLLTWTEMRKAGGLVNYGVPGTGKSAIAQAWAAEADIPLIMLDLGGMRGGIVGESEQNLRNALATIDAMTGNGRVYMIATCNRVDTIPSELLGRFKDGIWFSDLPNEDQRATIWPIYIQQFGLPEQALPTADGWAGRQIEQCCYNAYRFDCSLMEASNYVVPLAASMRRRIAEMREEAHLTYHSVEAPGGYVKPDFQDVTTPATNLGTAPGRAFSLEV